MSVLRIINKHKFFFIWHSIMVASTAYMGLYTIMTVNAVMASLLIGVESFHQKRMKNKLHDLTIRASNSGRLRIMIYKNNDLFPCVLQSLVEEKVNDSRS